MPVTSAVPGSLVSTTLVLPQAARAPVAWQVRDGQGNLVTRGQSPATGSQVIISFVLPSTSVVPTDGSKYSLTASDGTTSAAEYFSVLAPQSLQTQHVTEVAYMQGRSFRDTLVLTEQADSVSVQVYLYTGTVLIPPTQITAPPTRVGDTFAYQFDWGTMGGASTTPPGVVNTATGSTMGLGTIVWDYTRPMDVEPSQEIHTFYTVTPYAVSFMDAIRKLIDKARIGDANEYLRYTTSDLCHALVRGCDYVMQSPPLAGGWALDNMPYSLRDYIIKAGAVDVLRAQYEAEGMSQFDLQGLGVQLSVDRTQYLDGLINQLVSDLQGLPAAKNSWLSQGGPLGATFAAGKRALGVLGLSSGLYSNYPVLPLPLAANGAYSFIGNGFGFGPYL